MLAGVDLDSVELFLFDILEHPFRLQDCLLQLLLFVARDQLTRAPRAELASGRKSRCEGEKVERWSLSLREPNS